MEVSDFQISYTQQKKEGEEATLLEASFQNIAQLRTYAYAYAATYLRYLARYIAYTCVCGIMAITVREWLSDCLPSVTYLENAGETQY